MGLEVGGQEWVGGDAGGGLTAVAPGETGSFWKEHDITTAPAEIKQ